jgi:hypothetical protein
MNNSQLKARLTRYENMIKDYKEKPFQTIPSKNDKRKYYEV